MLAVLVLMSLTSFAPAQGKGQGKGQNKEKPTKPPKPDEDDLPEMYTISIMNNPGTYGFGFDGCTTNEFVYATPVKGKYTFWLNSDGIHTLGPNGEEAPLTMKVYLGADFVKENCTLETDVCHGNLPEMDPPILYNMEFADQGWDLEDYAYSTKREGLTVRFYKDGYAEILWFLDYVPNPKGHGSGWIIRNRYMQTTSTPFPAGGIPDDGSPVYIDITGPFWVQHDGVGVDTYDPGDYREEFYMSITLVIRRVVQ